MIKKFYFTLAVITAASFSLVSAQQTAKVTASGIGYLEYLPQGYHSNSNKYPVVISLHGIKEKGTTSNDRNRILADLARVDNVGLPKYVKNGKKYPFILISPQLKSNIGVWPGSYVMEVLNYVKKTLRIDEHRIYLTGLSLGGFGVWKTAGDYPDVFAAIAPICAGGNAMKKANAIAAANLPVWGFHGSSDKIVSYKVTTAMVNAVNSAPKKPNPLAKATLFAGAGHVIWDKAYNETNVIDWMLQHRKGSVPPSSGNDDNNDSGGSKDDDNSKGDDNKGDDNKDKTNKSPIVKAGGDKTITLPTNNLQIQGTAADPDGKITSIRWEKVSGGNASVSGTNGSRLRLNNLREGTYVFRLTAKDNDGAIKSDDMTVFVRASNNNNNNNNNGKEPGKGKPAAKNIIPFATAGPDRVITSNNVLIQGRASDKDGKIVSYEWTQTYGGRVNMSGDRTERVRITNMEKGVHIFRFRVKDNDGAVKDDYFKITVTTPKKAAQRKNNSTARGNSKPSGRSNAAPQAYAGPDRVTTSDAINISAKASDKDGSIVSYQWTQTYGDKVVLNGAHRPTVRISRLTPGVHMFRLTVKDNDGAVKHDYFKITVKGDRNDMARN
jgi:dienelactone hydrolase